MEKINFVNNSEPYLSAENLNQMQDNMESAINGIVLYENAEGSNETITLSDNVNNYNNVEILFRDDKEIYNTVKFIVKNDSWYSIHSIHYEKANEQIVVRGKNIKLYENLITNGDYAAVVYTTSGNAIYWNNNIYIVKVIGYK